MADDSDIDFRIDKGFSRGLELAGLLLNLKGHLGYFGRFDSVRGLAVKLTDNFRECYPAVPWRQIKAMRIS